MAPASATTRPSNTTTRATWDRTTLMRPMVAGADRRRVGSGTQVGYVRGRTPRVAPGPMTRVRRQGQGGVELISAERSTPMNEPIVVSDELTKRYGRHTVVDAVSLTVRRGEIYGFLGPNGAGKTTTLRMLVGLVRPTRGSARVLGGRPGDASVLRRVGALIEGPGFYPYLSGRDNLRVLARYNRLTDADVEQALDQVDLRARGGDTYKSYSLGMKQRLGVAAALLGASSLLLRAEPAVRAEQVIAATLGAVDVRRTADGGLEVLAEPDRNPELVRALVAAGVEVHEIRSFERTLEEAFFEMTNHGPREEMAR